MSYNCKNCGMTLAGMETCDCPLGLNAHAEVLVWIDEMPPTMHSVILSSKLEERFAKVLAETGLSPSVFIETALEAAIRQNENYIRVQPKHRPKNPVGRPRLTAQEKQFRDAVRDIDEIYLSLENEYLNKPGVFEELFGGQLDIYKKAVAEQDYRTVQWWQQNAPWQKKNPADFNFLWTNRESKDDTLTSNLSEEG